MIDQRQFLSSEITELEELLAVVPEERFIERLSLESRLELVRAMLAELPDKVLEAKETLRGRFQGVLPESRTFEFLLIDEDRLLKGQLGNAIDDPAVLNREWLYKTVSVDFNVIKEGEVYSRYFLMSIDDILEEKG